MKIIANAKSIQNLESQLDNLRNACGNAGAIIAKEALKNGGKADVDINALLLATDNELGASAIFDNFILLDVLTQKPLIHALLRQTLSKQ